MEVCRRDSLAALLVQRYSGLRRNVSERSVSVVVEEHVGGGRVHHRVADISPTVGPAAGNVDLDAPLGVAQHVEVKEAVTIVVEPDRARAISMNAYSRLGGHILECAVTAIA